MAYYVPGEQNMNTAESPLLRIPAELRNQIYNYVFEERNVHVTTRTGLEGVSQQELIFLWCRSCDAQTEPSQNHVAATTDEQPEALSRQYFERIAPAYTWCESTGAFEKRPLDLSLLRVCKQLYAETRLLPFSTYTFLVVAPQELSVFIKKLLPHQRQAIRSLHLHARLMYVPGWNKLFTPEFVSSLPKLRKLNLAIFKKKYRPSRQDLLGRVLEVQNAGYLLYGLYNLGRLPLEMVHVTVESQHRWRCTGVLADVPSRRRSDSTWTPELIQRWEQAIRTKFLAEFDERWWQDIEM